MPKTRHGGPTGSLGDQSCEPPLYGAFFVKRFQSGAHCLDRANHMPWRQFLLGNALGALAWASIFGFAAYILGRQVERVAGPMVIAIGVVALILIVIAVIFVGRREAQLMAEAERALPGPLKNRRDRPSAGE